jgi:tRNA1(Val) A37 N6-methylase TrmN6
MPEKQDIFTMLGGRVRFYRGTYNPTSDAAWLAAFVAHGKYKTVLDVGVGTGGAVLCLLANTNIASVTGIDTSDIMLNTCARNAELNNCAMELINADIMNWRTSRTFDLVITNPPYFRGTPAAHNAHHNADIMKWTQKSVARVKPRGTFCTIVDAKMASDVISVLNNVCGDITIFPLFSKKHTAERVIIRARVGTHGPTTIYDGLPMNCDVVLRDGLTIYDTLAKLDTQC